MTKVHVIGPNLRDNAHVFHVHAEGCADVKRSPLYRSPEFRYDRETVTEYADVRAMVDDVYQDQIAESGDPDEGRYYVQDFKVFPCVPVEFTKPNETV